MPGKQDRLVELMNLLGSHAPRGGLHPGESDFPEGRWAAIMIKNEFGKDSIIPLAGAIRFWKLFDPNNHIFIRQFGFRDPEVARRWRSAAILNAAWCLREIYSSETVLLEELKNESATRMANAATAFGMVNFGSFRAVESLINTLNDSDKEVIEAASYALSSITKSHLFLGRRILRNGKSGGAKISRSLKRKVVNRRKFAPFCYFEIILVRHIQH